jgi:biopolymer transport protein ExbD
MSSMVFRTRKRKQVSLSVTPLIDVLFLLLIFFMVTGTFKRAGELELRLPESSTSTPSKSESEAKDLELVLTEDGLLLLDGENVELPNLKRRLQTIVAEDAEKRVMIKAESGVQHWEVVRLLDIVREAGFPGVGLGTQLKPSQEEYATPSP